VRKVLFLFEQGVKKIDGSMHLQFFLSTMHEKGRGKRKLTSVLGFIIQEIEDN